MKYLGVNLVYCSSFCTIQEGWGNYGAVHNTVFYGEVFADPDLILQSDKGFLEVLNVSRQICDC